MHHSNIFLLLYILYRKYQFRQNSGYMRYLGKLCIFLYNYYLLFQEYNRAKDLLCILYTRFLYKLRSFLLRHLHQIYCSLYIYKLYYQDILENHSKSSEYRSAKEKLDLIGKKTSLRSSKTKSGLKQIKNSQSTLRR